MIREVFLVKKSVVAQYFDEQGIDLFIDNVKKLNVLPEPPDEDSDGESDSVFASVVISEEASAQIHRAAIDATKFGELPSVQPTDFAIEQITESFLAASDAGSSVDK